MFFWWKIWTWESYSNGRNRSFSRKQWYCCSKCCIILIDSFCWWYGLWIGDGAYSSMISHEMSHADEVLKWFLLDHWMYVSKQKVCVVPGCYGIGWFSRKSWVWDRPDFSQLLRWPSSQCHSHSIVAPAWNLPRKATIHNFFVPGETENAKEQEKQ